VWPPVNDGPGVACAPAAVYTDVINDVIRTGLS